MIFIKLVTTLQLILDNRNNFDSWLRGSNLNPLDFKTDTHKFIKLAKIASETKQLSKLETILVNSSFFEESMFGTHNIYDTALKVLDLTSQRVVELEEKIISDDKKIKDKKVNNCVISPYKDLTLEMFKFLKGPYKDLTLEMFKFLKDSKESYNIYRKVDSKRVLEKGQLITLPEYYINYCDNTDLEIEIFDTGFSSRGWFDVGDDITSYYLKKIKFQENRYLFCYSPHENYFLENQSEFIENVYDTKTGKRTFDGRNFCLYHKNGNKYICISNNMSKYIYSSSEEQTYICAAELNILN
uniref:Uncharacterized protein n=1 Tax=viral metagenome TaxID=1070528 RepID=A0A6C0BEZ4_9ZZZZ